MKAEHITQAYQVAKERYAAIGVDTDATLKKLQAIKISMHCWQGDGPAAYRLISAYFENYDAHY